MRNVVSYRVHPREWFGRGSDRYRTQLDGNSIVQYRANSSEQYPYGTEGLLVSYGVLRADRKGRALNFNLLRLFYRLLRKRLFFSY